MEDGFLSVTAFRELFVGPPGVSRCNSMRERKMFYSVFAGHVAELTSVRAGELAVTVNSIEARAGWLLP